MDPILVTLEGRLLRFDFEQIFFMFWRAFAFIGNNAR